MAGKNPYTSLWLSGANMWAGAARSFWTAETKRQQNAMLKEATKQTVEFWSGSWMAPIGKGKGAKRRLS